MNQLVAWFARNSVAANLLMLFIVTGGLLTIGSIRREVFPEFSTDTISISVLYPGASPAEVEEAVCVRIEEEVHGLEGVKKISSVAVEGVGTVSVELLPGTDPSRMLDDVKSRVDAIDTFPAETEKPVVREVALRRQVIDVAISGDLDERSLKALGERVRDDLVTLPGITQAELQSARAFEISIEVAEEDLRQHSLTFDLVAEAVRRSSIDLPGGSVKTGGGEVLLRTQGQAYTGEDFEDLVLIAREDGTRVRLGDVATVRDGFADTDQSARFDGEPAVLVKVFRVGDQDALGVADAVKGYVRDARDRLPAGATLTTWRNDAEILQSRQDLLLRNGLTGFLLVFAVLALFLRLKLAIWVSLGIPISFLGTIWLMPMLGLSVNMLTLFAFIVVLGIVVDDAIVVGENIHTHSLRGKPGLAAAIDGTQEVAIPVTFAVLTTVAAFVPMLNVPGATGDLWAVIPMIVIPTLLFSMIESKLILPAHLRHLARVGEHPRGPAGVWSRFQRRFAGALEGFAQRMYRPALQFALERRYLTISIALSTFLLTLGLVGGGWVRFVFFPTVDGDDVVAILTMPQGTPADRTAAAVRRLEASALRLREELDPMADRGTAAPLFRHVLATVGEQPFRKIQEEGAGRVVEAFTGSHFGEVNIQLARSEDRTISSAEVADRWRELTGPIHGATNLEFSSSLFTIGADLDIRLKGPDLGALRAAADRLKAKLAEFDGVHEIADSLQAGKQEMKLSILDDAESLGLTMADLARQVRQGFYGEEAQRIQRGRDDIKVMVRYPDEQRRSLWDVEQMRIRTPSGDEVPFWSVAEAELGRGYSTIQRDDRQRAIAVTAAIDDIAADANDIFAELQADFLPALLADHPGLRYSIEGERREQQETLGGLGRGFVVAILMIYALMAIPFRSYLQPLIVMSVIPLGVVGAVIGHVIMGMALSVLSLCGIVALAGVVVNDSLVLVDFVNRKIAAGGDRVTAVREAGVARFRPILLTSLTTFAGLTPLLLEKSVQALFLIPMAISLAFGVMFATLITLVLVPAGYLILEDARHAARALAGRARAAR